MTDTEFVLTSTLCGLDIEGKHSAHQVITNTFLLPKFYPEIQIIKKISACLLEKQIAISSHTVLFEGKIELTLNYESPGISDIPQDFKVFIPFSFQDPQEYSEKAPSPLDTNFLLEYLKLDLKSPRHIWVESKICVLIDDVK